MSTLYAQQDEQQCWHPSLTWIGRSGSFDDVYRCDHCRLIRTLQQFQTAWQRQFTQRPATRSNLP